MCRCKRLRACRIRSARVFLVMILSLPRRRHLSGAFFQHNNKARGCLFPRRHEPNESVLSPAALQVRPALDGSWIGALRRRLSRAAVCPDSLRWSACVLKAVPGWALVDHAREVNSPTRSSGPAVSASGCGGERPDGKSDVGQWNRVGVERPITPLRVATGFAVRWVCFAR